MKKKIWAICLTLVLALAAFAISGCSLFNDAGTISWVKEPAKVYSLGDTTGLSFEISVQIKGTDEIQTVKYPENTAIVVKGFSTSKVGTFTATVTYEKLTLSFSYKVADGKFTDGTGTASDPYIISTNGQFQEMLNQKTFKYYKLANDLDFTGKTIKMANKGAAATDAEAWVGELDGNGYVVKGISDVRTPNGEVSNKYNEIFGRVSRDGQKFTLKNITFNFASQGTSATMGITTCNGMNGIVEFNKVNVTGYLNVSYSSNTNIGVYMSFVQRYLPDGDKPTATLQSLTFTDCKNDIKVLNAYGAYRVAGYAAGMTLIPDNAVKFTNCEFSGLIEGSYDMGASAFFTNYYGGSKNATGAYVFSGCKVSHKEGEYNIIKTAGIGSNDVKYGCGNIAIYANGVIANVVESGITGEVAINSDIKVVNVQVGTDLKLDCSVVDGTADNYRIYVLGGMTYDNGKGGVVRLEQPVDTTKLVDGAIVKQDLLKIKYSDADAPAVDGEIKYGSPLIVNNNGTLVYYGKTVCASIDMTKTTIVVVAYKNGKAVAIGTAKNVNLAA